MVNCKDDSTTKLLGEPMNTTNALVQGEESLNGLTNLIARQVIQSLGSPMNFFKVRVHPVGTDRYRVNVLVGENAALARIANSFFLTADDKGNVLTSSPKIVRLY